MTPEELTKLCDELEALLKEATPGPWIVDQETDHGGYVYRKDLKLISALRNAAQPLIDAARESVRLRAKLVTGFYGDNVPTFHQGEPEHELEDLITADECAGYIKRISGLRAELDKLRKERDEAYERAAQVCDDVCKDSMHAEDAAARIRALKDKP